MNTRITIERLDGGCEPWEFTEIKFSSISIAREQMSLLVDRFNLWADATKQVRLKFTVAMVPMPEVQHAQPNSRELQRLMNQPKR